MLLIIVKYAINALLKYKKLYIKDIHMIGRIFRVHLIF